MESVLHYKVTGLAYASGCKQDESHHFEGSQMVLVLNKGDSRLGCIKNFHLISFENRLLYTQQSVFSLWGPLKSEQNRK